MQPENLSFYNADDYNLQFQLPVSEPNIRGVAILNDDTIVVSAGYFLYFIEASTESVLARVQNEYYIYSFTDLRDGRIALGGGGGKCEGFCAIITLSKSVQGAVDDSVAALYQCSSVEHSNIQPAWPEEFVHGDIASKSMTVTMQDASHSEMMRWKAKGISKKLLLTLDSEDAAACLVAFLLNYEAGKEEKFFELKEIITKEFQKNWIYGAHFVDENEEEKGDLANMLLAALKNVA